jgi:hypothetical protein
MTDEKLRGVPAGWQPEKTEIVKVMFRGRAYPAVVKEGEILGWQCKLPRAQNSAAFEDAIRKALGR